MLKTFSDKRFRVETVVETLKIQFIRVEHSGVVEGGGGLRGAEPPYIFCTLHIDLNNVKNTHKNISKRERSLESHLIFSHHLTH
jgi:hypothetical protein